MKNDLASIRSKARQYFDEDDMCQMALNRVAIAISLENFMPPDGEYLGDKFHLFRLLPDVSPKHVGTHFGVPYCTDCRLDKVVVVAEVTHTTVDEFCQSCVLGWKNETSR